jgi:Flp pilus assembly protein TadG
MKPAIPLLRRFTRDRSGLAAIELAIIAPVLLLCALCVADLGRYALDKTWVTDAVSAGAEYAAAKAQNYAPTYPMGSAFSAAVIAAATSATPATSISVSPTPSSYYGCATSAGVVTAIDGTPVTSSTVCPAATSTGGPAGQYVSVMATMPFTALFSAAGIIYPTTISSTAAVRIQ